MMGCLEDGVIAFDSEDYEDCWEDERNEDDDYDDDDCLDSYCLRSSLVFSFDSFF